MGKKAKLTGFKQIQTKNKIKPQHLLYVCFVNILVSLHKINPTRKHVFVDTDLNKPPKTAPTINLNKQRTRKCGFLSELYGYVRQRVDKSTCLHDSANCMASSKIVPSDPKKSFVMLLSIKPHSPSV